MRGLRGDCHDFPGSHDCIEPGVYRRVPD
jgi:hypothetical protein